MNCYNHPDNVSVATCVDCGKGLCKECASMYAIPICTTCNSIRVKNDKNIIARKYVPSLIGAIAGICFTLIMTKDLKQPVFLTIGQVIAMAYVFAGIHWGWFVISFITPKMFLFMSWAGWAFYFVIKLCLSMFVGIVALPIGLTNLLMKGISAKNKENFIKNNQ